MFRKMRRIRQQLTEDQCIDLLKKEKRCVLSFNGDDGYPSGVPMNFYYDEGRGSIFLHGAKSGHRMDSVKKDNKVCFTIYNSGVKLNKDDWAYYVASVMVYGRLCLVDDRELANQKAIKLAEKYFPDRKEIDETMERYARHMQVFELRMEHMTGKLVHEK